MIWPISDSTDACRQGAPGSMKTDSVELSRHQSVMACQVIFGPLSMRITSRCPRSLVRQSRLHAGQRSVMKRSTSIADVDLVNLSFTGRTFETCPSAVYSNVKCNAHTGFGCCVEWSGAGQPTTAHARRCYTPEAAIR